MNNKIYVAHIILRDAKKLSTLHISFHRSIKGIIDALKDYIKITEGFDTIYATDRSEFLEGDKNAYCVFDYQKKEKVISIPTRIRLKDDEKIYDCNISISYFPSLRESDLMRYYGTDEFNHKILDYEEFDVNKIKTIYALMYIDTNTIIDYFISSEKRKEKIYEILSNPNYNHRPFKSVEFDIKD